MSHFADQSVLRHHRRTSKYTQVETLMKILHSFHGPIGCRWSHRVFHYKTFTFAMYVFILSMDLKDNLSIDRNDLHPTIEVAHWIERTWMSRNRSEYRRKIGIWCFWSRNFDKTSSIFLEDVANDDNSVNQSNKSKSFSWDCVELIDFSLIFPDNWR